MNSQPESPIPSKHLVILGLMGFVELLAALILLALTAGRYTGDFLFGLAARGILEVVLLALLTLGFLALAVIGLQPNSQLNSNLKKFIKRQKIFLIVLAALGLVFGWVSATIPPDFFGRFSSYYQWLRPVGFALGLIALQTSGLYLWRSGNYGALLEPVGIFKSKLFWIVFGLVVTLFGFSYLTKFGMVANTPLWNVPGVPLSGTQMLLVVIPFAGLLCLYSLSPRFRALLAGKSAQTIIIVSIYVIAVLAWGFTHLNGDSLAVEVSEVNLQPYPQRDARVHDLGALSILWGKGINFKEYTDKPLYMVILAGLHLVTGSDYNFLQWVLVAVLAVIPVLFYLFGKRFHSSLFGVMLAVLVILQQRNAVALSRMISSVNVKLLATETFVLLGVILLALLLFKWNEQNDKHVLLLLGGVSGALSLIRLNPILLVPFIALLIIIVYWKRKRLILPRLLLFALGFLVVFTPWVISGQNAEGQPYLIVKVRDIFLHRIAPQITGGKTSQSAGLAHIEQVAPDSAGSTLQFDSPAGYQPMEVNLAGFINTANLFARMESVVGAGGGAQYLKLLANHYVHNIITSIMPLPDVLSREGVRVLAQRDYWDDRMIWDGGISSGLLRFIAINLALLSLGIAASWRSHRWKGLIPLGLFLVYNLAISISLTSGGRYIVPIIWVFFMYYALGIVYLLQMMVRLIQPTSAVDARVSPEHPRNGGKTRLLPVFIALILVALLIPIANQLVPLIVTTSPVDKADALIDQLAPGEASDSRYVNGIILYPVYSPDFPEVRFDFYQGKRTREVAISFASQVETELEYADFLTSGEPARLVFNDGDELTAIHVIRDDRLVEYWSLPADAANTP